MRNTIHSMGRPSEEKSNHPLTIPNVIGRMAKSGIGTLLILGLLLVAIGVLCVEVQNHFGSTWAGFVGIVLVPLILANFMRSAVKKPK